MFFFFPIIGIIADLSGENVFLSDFFGIKYSEYLSKISAEININPPRSVRPYESIELHTVDPKYKYCFSRFGRFEFPFKNECPK